VVQVRGIAQVPHMLNLVIVRVLKGRHLEHEPWRDGCGRCGDEAGGQRGEGSWHLRFVYESKNVDIRESQAVLILLAAIPANRRAASALAELLSRRQGLERTCGVLVSWARGA
jgi:hypothetical protein